MPEEGLRQMISRVGTLHFCPTEMASNNLQREGINDGVFVTGNTVVDALFHMSDRYRLDATLMVEKWHLGYEKLVLVTCHRRENHGLGVLQVSSAVKILSRRFSRAKFIIPVHPNPNVKGVFLSKLSGIDNVLLTSPQSYPVLVELEKQADLILTDSGGIQEEAPSFGTPILVLRNTTERPEGVQAGCAKLIGTDVSAIVNESSKVLMNPIGKSALIKNPYGDGLASKRILSLIKGFFNVNL